MESRTINVGGKIIDLSKLTDSELEELLTQLKLNESKYRKKIKLYEEKYDFLQKKE